MKKSGVFVSGSISILSAVLLMIFSSGCRKTFSGQEDGFPTGQDNILLKERKTNNFMVISHSESITPDFESQLSAYGEIVRTIPEIGVVVVRPSTADFEVTVSKLQGVFSVVPDLVAKWIEPGNFVPEANPPSIGSDEPLFRYQWGMDAINAPEAWNKGFKGKGSRVFVLDSGIDAEHPDLASNLNTALCSSFVPGESYNVAPGFYFSHGTHVAGIIAAANNSYGVIGTAPEAEIVAVKVLSEVSGSGAFSWINAGIVYAANNGADVINMSLGAVFNRNGFYLDENDVLQKIPAVYIQSLILAQQRAVNYATRLGAVIVVSAGNGYTDFDGNASFFKIPAELQNVTAVSATAPDYLYGDLRNGVTDPNLDLRSSYTDFGKSLVHIAAPGGDSDYYPLTNWHMDMVLSTISGGWGWAAGTSMAAPHVAGVAALIKSRGGDRISPDEIRKQLLKTADNLDGNGISDFYGKGRVNALRAVTE